MEHLEVKIRNNNSVVLAQIFSRLIETIKRNYKDDGKELEELTFLKEKCLNGTQKVVEIATDSIIKLIQLEVLQAQTLLAEFLTLLHGAKNFSGGVRLINHLLLYCMDTKKNHYNLWSPQHPFITVLNKDIDNFLFIHNEMKCFYMNSPPGLVSIYNHFHRAFFLYIFCNPHNAKLNVWQLKLWEILCNYDENCKMIEDLLSWMQTDSGPSVYLTSEYFGVISTVSSDLSDLKAEVTLNFQIALLHNLLEGDLDPRTTLEHIDYVLSEKKTLEWGNCMLLILAKIINNCPSSYIVEVLKICDSTVRKTECSFYILKSIEAALMQWTTTSILLCPEVAKWGNNLYSTLQMYKRSPDVATSKANELTQRLKHMLASNNIVYLNHCLAHIMISWENEFYVLLFLEQLDHAPEYFIKKVIHVLYGLFIADTNNININLKALKLIMRTIGVYRELSLSFITLLFFKITNTEETELHFQILKAIPQMGHEKENCPKIVAFLHALGEGNDILKTMSMTLMFELWKIENRCYTHLENLLVKNFPKNWEFLINKARILKEVCCLRPKLYGKDIVAHLSKILNECDSPEGAVASRFALEAIAVLCRAGVIDIVTTWSAISPKFENEKRVAIIKSLCDLLSEIPHLSYTESYPEFLSAAITKLWQYATNPDVEVKRAGLMALAEFPLDQICLKFPAEFLDEDTMKKKQKNLEVQLIPGRCWVHFIKNQPHLETNVDFLIKMVSLEVKSFLKFVYHVKGSKEPIHYDFLPSYSIVRAIAEFLKENQRKLYTPVYFQCLRIFSQEYSKPLPPFDWCFLQEHLHDKDAKKYCLSIAAHQVMLSGSARRLIENYLLVLGKNIDNEEDVKIMYANLRYLSNSIQPVVMKPFLEKSLTYSIEYHEGQKDSTLLKYVVEKLRENLLLPDIQETNKNTISEVLVNLIAKLGFSDQILDILLEAAIYMPPKFLDCISSPKLGGPLPELLFQKAVKIRCSIAKRAESPSLTWLNEILEDEASLTHQLYILKEFVNVFQDHATYKDAPNWILELIGMIEAKSVDSDAPYIVFLCDVFIVAVVVYSQYNNFSNSMEPLNLDKYIELCPQAVGSLFDETAWSICTTQAMEWFYHMNTDATIGIPTKYKNMFCLALKSLRHDEEFRKNMKWMKYLNSATN